MTWQSGTRSNPLRGERYDHTEYLGMLMFINMVLSIYMYVTIRNDKINRYTEMIVISAILIMSAWFILGIFWIYQGEAP